MIKNLTYKDLAVIALLLGPVLFRKIHEPIDDKSVTAGMNRCHFNTVKGGIFADRWLAVTVIIVCEFHYENLQAPMATDRRAEGQQLTCKERNNLIRTVDSAIHISITLWNPNYSCELQQSSPN